jgi:ribose/xylose/arabinose/galactoside ABC-type transport system permease subunit
VLPAAGPAGDLALPHLIGSAVTLVLGGVVALVMYFSTPDLPGDFLGDSVIPSAMLLVAIAAPVALLVAWGEVDLSAIGVLPFAAWIYSEVADAGVVPGLAAAGAACCVIGLCIGLVRWATRAPSAVVSLGAGFLLQAVAVQQIGVQGPTVLEDGFIDGSGLPVLAGLAFTTLALAAAVALQRAGLGPDRGAAVEPSPGPRVVAGFGLSAAAAGTYGAMTVGITRAVVPTGGSDVLLLVFCAVAIGGVVRGNRLVGPVAAALGAVATQLMVSSGVIRNWDLFDTRIVVAVILILCLLLAHGLNRLLTPNPWPDGPPR